MPKYFEELKAKLTTAPVLLMVLLFTVMLLTKVWGVF